MPIYRCLHFHDFAVVPLSPNLRNKSKKLSLIDENMSTNTWMKKKNGDCLNVPPHSSMRLAIVSASSSAILRILLSPSRTTWTTWASFTISRLQNGGITCFSIRCATYMQRNVKKYWYFGSTSQPPDDGNKWDIREFGRSVPVPFCHLLWGCWWPRLLLFEFQSHPARKYAFKVSNTHLHRFKIYICDPFDIVNGEE